MKRINQILKQHTVLVVSVFLLLLWALFIFGMSGESGEESAGLSEVIAQEVYKLSMMRHLFKFNTLHFLIRKCAHFTEYGILEILLLNVVYQMGLFEKNLRDDSIGERGQNRNISGKERYHWILFATTVFLCFLYASLDEFHQTFVSGRDGNIRDVFIDTSGAFFFGILAFYGIIKILKLKKSGD